VRAWTSFANPVDGIDPRPAAGCNPLIDVNEKFRQRSEIENFESVHKIPSKARCESGNTLSPRREGVVEIE
jgi:hypothetical protein